MKAVLFAAGVSVVAGQYVEGSLGAGCIQQSVSNCTETYGCAMSGTAGMCGRNYSSSVITCSTASKTCETGVECMAMANKPSNWQTCSTCADNCHTHTQATCSGTAGSACTWYEPSCQPILAPTQCGGATTNAACTAKSNCFWVGYKHTVCGVEMDGSACLPCNGTLFTAPIRSAIKNQVGSSCTFAKAAPYDASYTFRTVEYGQHGMCTATTTTMGGDAQALGSILLTGATGALVRDVPFAGSSLANPTCTKASSAAALMPSLALLAIFAFSA